MPDLPPGFGNSDVIVSAAFQFFQDLFSTALGSISALIIGVGLALWILERLVRLAQGKQGGDTVVTHYRMSDEEDWD